MWFKRFVEFGEEIEEDKIPIKKTTRLKTPKSEHYSFYLLYLDSHNRFYYQPILGNEYTVDEDNFRVHKLGQIPHFLPKWAIKPYLYYQILPLYS